MTAWIGVTVGSRVNKNGLRFQQVPETYVQALARAGAAPVLVPLALDEDALGALLSRLDGLLFSGGGDIDPACYGSRMHPRVAGVDADRDRVELFLARRAAERGLPFLGICRGLQVLNVALGGSLYEDLPDQYPGALLHSQPNTQPRNTLAHTVRVEAGSRLAGILQSEQPGVNSLHHQGIRRLAPGLAATAHASDGLIEAVELPGHPFALAVQWHPECLLEQPPMRRLFSALVEAAE